eukprot:COSAG01_NODE_146_length_24099_cov_25.341208_26_plen_203_part_00
MHKQFMMLMHFSGRSSILSSRCCCFSFLPITAESGTQLGRRARCRTVNGNSTARRGGYRKCAASLGLCGAPELVARRPQEGCCLPLAASCGQWWWLAAAGCIAAAAAGSSRLRAAFHRFQPRSRSFNLRIVLTLIELHADRHQNSCWLHSCEAADFVIDCAAKLPAQLIITGGGWKSRRGTPRRAPSLSLLQRLRAAHRATS